jgi:hypothetical protein
LRRADARPAHFFHQMSVFSIFQDVSTEAISKGKAVKLLSNSLTKDFFDCILFILNSKKDAGNVEIVLEFLDEFFTKNDVFNGEYQSEFVDLLILGFGALNKDVRMRSSQLLALFVNSSEEIEDKEIKKIKKAAMLSVNDKVQQVRVNSTIILCRLQVFVHFMVGHWNDQGKSTSDRVINK